MSFVRRLMGRDPDRPDKLSEVPPADQADPVDVGAMVTNPDIGIGEAAAPSGVQVTGGVSDVPNMYKHTSPQPVGLRVGYVTEVGQIREHNEDTVVVFQGLQLGDDASDPFGLFIVADGMGGQQAGEVASSLAARLVTHHILDKVYLPYLLNRAPGTDMAPLTDILRDAVQRANDQVHEKVPGGGTTVTCALVLGRRAFIAHVGDSRAYLVTNYDVQQVTHDHSYVGRLLELGELSADEAAVHPQRHVLYRAVGQGENLDVDTYQQLLPPGSRLLLCSDGLSGSVSEQDIGKTIASAATQQEACERLVKAASEAGGPDNITVVLIQTPPG